MKLSKWLNITLRVVLSLGVALTLANFLLELDGKRLCHSEGCLVVDSFSKSDPLMNLLGFLFFGTALAGELLGLVELSGLLLTLALVSEGYLIGFQLFVIGKLCHFCFAVFILVFVSNLLYLFRNLAEGRDIKAILLGFLGFFVVLFMVWFVNPKIEKLPKVENVVIYSPNCPHCERVFSYCKSHNINATFVDINREKGLCHSLDLEEIPILVHRGDGKIEIIVGDEKILSYLKEGYGKRNRKKPMLNTPLLNGEACNMFEEKACSP